MVGDRSVNVDYDKCIPAVMASSYVTIILRICEDKIVKTRAASTRSRHGMVVEMVCAADIIVDLIKEL